MLIDRWLTRWSRNYALLRRAVDHVGKDLARGPYEVLLQPDTMSFDQFVNGVHMSFDVEIFRIDGDGTAWVRVTAQSALPTPLGIKPDLVFRKLRDGRAFVHH